MRVLFLSDRLSQRGGADWHLRGVIEALLRRGHQAHLAVGRVEKDAPPPCPSTVVPELAARGAAPVDLGPLMREVQPRLIHLQNVVNPEVLRWAGGERAVITVQDHRLFCPGRGKWTADGAVCRLPMDQGRCASCFADEAYFRSIYQLTRQRLGALARTPLVVLSRYMKRELVDAGVASQQIHVIPPFVHGFDPDARSTDPPCALFAGRLVEAKGVADAVAAWLRSGIGLPLAFAGTGPLRGKIQQPGCEVMGWIPHHQLSSLYRRAKVLLLPSRWQEPFGIVGLEACFMGLPVAAWDSGGVKEWLDPAALVPWGDVEGLAAAAVTMMRKRPQMPPGFEEQLLTQRLLELYEGL